jgi:lambda repressor-like predicted transcriptional regulator
VLSEDKVLDMSDRTMQSLKKPIHKLSQQAGISHSSAEAVLKKTVPKSLQDNISV